MKVTLLLVAPCNFVCNSLFCIGVDMPYQNISVVSPEETTGDINGSWNDTSAGMKHIPFQKRAGLLIDAGENTTPYDYFRLLLDDNLLELIVRESNSYAENIFLNEGTYEHSRITRWKEITKAELLLFIGLLLHTGTIKCNILKDYWKRHWLFGLTCFSKYMSRDRFFLILRCLHFAENIVGGDPPEDRLYKIRPVLNYFQAKMNTIYYPGKNLSLDESMLLWRGRLIFRQYLQNKRHKYGIKMYMITEPDGLILNLLVYTGQADELGGIGHAEKVVLKLANNYLNNGHSIFMDNFYNSYSLAKKLLEKNTYCTGTLRAGRKESPKDIITKKLQKGETYAAYRDGIMIGKWRDKREVLYISTEFCNEMVETHNKRGVLKEKPRPIAEYNKYMGGIDRMDQMMAYYPCVRKTLRWYKKLGIHMFQLLFYNAFILYTKYSGKRLSYYNFRLAVLEKILPEVNTAKPNPVKQVASHFPVKIEGKNESGRVLRKRCKVCWKNKVRKDSSYHCTVCPDAPGLCIGKCFEEYHRN